MRLLLCGLLFFATVAGSLRTVGASVRVSTPTESQSPVEENNQANEITAHVVARRQVENRTTAGRLPPRSASRRVGARLVKFVLCKATSGHTLANGLRAPLRC